MTAIVECVKRASDIRAKRVCRIALNSILRRVDCGSHAKQWASFDAYRIPVAHWMEVFASVGCSGHRWLLRGECVLQRLEFQVSTEMEAITFSKTRALVCDDQNDDRRE